MQAGDLHPLQGDLGVKHDRTYEEVSAFSSYVRSDFEHRFWCVVRPAEATGVARAASSEQRAV